MSLINEALKKAEKNRMANGSPSGLPPKAASRGNPAGAPGFNIMRWSVTIILFSCAIGAAIGFLVVVAGGDDPGPPPSPREVAIAIEPPKVPQPQVSRDVTQPVAANAGALFEPRQLAMAQTDPIIPYPVLSTVIEPELVASLAAAADDPATDATAGTVIPTPPAAETLPAASAAPQTSEPPDQPIRPLSEQPVRVAHTKNPAAAATPSDAAIRATEMVTDTPHANPAIIAFLEASRITGVKTAGRQSRILMNNRVYRIDSVIHDETGLRITDIQNNHINLIDESGIQYRKTF